MLAALDGETRDWVQALGNKFGGGCCDTADGFPVEVDGWDMAGTVDDTFAMTELDARYARSGYRVRLGRWQMARRAELRVVRGPIEPRFRWSAPLHDGTVRRRASATARRSVAQPG
jgi:hypothetical protein